MAEIVLPQDKGWTRLGPGGGGAMFEPTVSPHDPKTAVITCDMTGQYVTRDAGRTWHMCTVRTKVDTFCFDPVDPDRLYAGANALYATDDFGKHWYIVWPGADTPRQTILRGDEAGATYVGGNWPQRRVSALAIDRANNDRIFAGLAGREEAEVYLTEDRGRSWRKLASLPGARVHKLAIDPASPQTVWAIASGGVFRSEDGGATWSPVAVEGAGAVLGGEVGFEADRTRLYVVAGPQGEGRAGLFVSDNGGASWWFAGAGVQLQSRIAVKSVGICRDHPEIAYLATGTSRPGPGDRALLSIGIAKSADGGKTWTWSFRAGEKLEHRSGESDWEGEFEEPANFELDWLSKCYSTFWADIPYGFGVAPTNPDYCYATDMGRAIMTENGGATWRGMINRFDEQGGTYTAGLDVTTCYGVHFDPHHAGVSFISYTDIGLFKSFNVDKSWHHRLKGVPRGWHNTCYWLVFDPEVPDKLWSVWSSGHDYPRVKMYRGGKASRYQGGVAVSEDNGETWRKQMEGMPEVGCTQIVLDPTSSAGKRTLYVVAHGRGVYKSTDDGVTWTLKNKGLREDNLNAWWLSGDPAGTMYLLVTRDLDANQNSIPGGVYRTTDGAETWERMAVSEEAAFPNDLCVHPADPKTLYLAAWPVRLPDRVCEGGVMKSTDGGASWRRLPFVGRYVYALLIDPREPGVVYATTWHHGVFRSEDGGQTWARLGGANFGWPHRLFPDPNDPAMLYLTTFGGSVWHGPKLGTPGAGPDITDLPAVTEVRP